MKLYIEEHLISKINPVLFRVDAWKLPFDIELVENIRALPFDMATNKDHSWSIIMPKNENTGFIYDYKYHSIMIKSYAGGAFPNRIAIIVYGTETEEVLELRIVHEYLHSMGKAADDLSKNIPRFLTWWERLLYYFKILKIDESAPFWQRKYYNWLFKT